MLENFYWNCFFFESDKIYMKEKKDKQLWRQMGNFIQRLYKKLFDMKKTMIRCAASSVKNCTRVP